MKVRIRRSGLATLVAAATAVAGAGDALAARAPDAKLTGPADSERAVVTLSITRLGNGTITSTPAGILCGPGPTETRCSADFAPGTQITLRAQPIVGWAWHYWDGACVGRTTPTCSFQIATETSALVIFIGVDAYRATFNPRWSNSRLNGTLDVSGIASHEANLAFALRQGFSDTVLATGRLHVAAPGGNFNMSIPLRNVKILPGRHIVRLTGDISGRRAPVRDFLIVLAPPREGLVTRAWVTPLGSRSPVVLLPRGAVGAEAHFQFAFRPAPGSRVVATWFQGRIKLGSASKPRARIVHSKVLRPGGLPRGFFYRCVLTVNGVVVKETGVKTRG